MQYKIICRTDKLNKNGEAPLVGNTLTNSFVEKNITYDKNTNLLTLKRYNNGTLTDDLSFSYLGNRRVGYNCDLNGNITNDATENLQVSYNFLNLLTAISQNSEVKARYSYAAADCRQREYVNCKRAGVCDTLDPWLTEKLAHFDREVIPERRMHAKRVGAYDIFTVTHDSSPYTRTSIFAEVGKQTPF